MEDLKEFLAAAPKRVVREVFGDGDTAFEVELRLCSRADLETMRKQATKRVLDKPTRQYREELDVEKLRHYLRDHCITNWSDLNFAKAAALCNRSLPNGQFQEWGPQPVPCSAQNRQMLLEEAIGFEDWVWEKATALAEVREQIEQEKKVTSGSTSAAT